MNTQPVADSSFRARRIQTAAERPLPTHHTIKIMAIDPICHMEVDESTALRAEKDGKTYYFCCEHCRQKFLSPPVLLSLGGVGSAGVRERGSAPGLARSRAPALPPTYICPMCPGVSSDKPG